LLSAALVVILSVSKQWSMKPVSLMTKGSSKVTFSRLLFTIQFVISITLAICAVTIIQQMNYIENAPLGFNRHIIQLNTPDKKYSEMLPVLKQKISQLPDVNNVTAGSGNPIFGNMVTRYTLENEQFYTPYLFEGDEDFLKTLDLKLIEGELPSEKNNGKLVNQTLVRQFNLKTPIGEPVPGTKDIIIGVVEDFTCSSFKQEIPPVVISYNKTGQTLLVNYEGNNLSRLLPQLQAEWKGLFPDYPFAYRIVQEELMKKYREDTFFYKIIITFSIISMILSCFGLFALSWAVIQSRTKEIGIRKVLGATAVDILHLLTLTFTKRIGIAFLIAAPMGYYLMNQWLARFANKIELNIWIFGISGLIVITVAFVTLSLQTVKATMTNPVDEIRNE
jgi:putative ABC transport system permease protein